jgi:hypothetical protein
VGQADISRISASGKKQAEHGQPAYGHQQPVPVARSQGRTHDKNQGGTQQKQVSWRQRGDLVDRHSDDLKGLQ